MTRLIAKSEEGQSDGHTNHSWRSVNRLTTVTIVIVQQATNGQTNKLANIQSKDKYWLISWHTDKLANIQPTD